MVVSRPVGSMPRLFMALGTNEALAVFQELKKLIVALPHARLLVTAVSSTLPAWDDIAPEMAVGLVVNVPMSVICPAHDQFLPVPLCGQSATGTGAPRTTVVTRVNVSLAQVLFTPATGLSWVPPSARRPVIGGHDRPLAALWKVTDRARREVEVSPDRLGPSWMLVRPWFR